MIAIPTMSNANEALSLVGRVTDLVKKGATIDLQETIVQLREAILALKEENLNLKEQMSSLQLIVDRQANLEFIAPNYYATLEGGKRDGPFCQVCHDNEDKLIRLIQAEEGSWHCGVCKGYFETQQHKAMVNAQVRRYNDSLKDDW
ncbi:MAG: hypothetical protein Q8L53_01850 [Aestuariivirga sp.]|nr:hypothetical protein [Aestuariivirga sp.]